MIFPKRSVPFSGPDLESVFRSVPLLWLSAAAQSLPGEAVYRKANG